MNSIGFSIVISEINEPRLEQTLRSMQDAGCTAFELNMTKGVPPKLSNRLLDLLGTSDYRSIHLPDVGATTQDQANLTAYLALADQLKAQSCTIHPHKVEDWRWLEDAFGSRLAVENMDWRKPSGRYPDELAKIFRQAPSARWTFDLNHIYSLDPTMALGEEFYRRFSDRLAHYHISGFAGAKKPHTTLADNDQDQIITAVRDDKPVIIESLGETETADFQTELRYVQAHLQPASSVAPSLY
jgi:hypothetical protein